MNEQQAAKAMQDRCRELCVQVFNEVSKGNWHNYADAIDSLELRIAAINIDELLKK